MAVGTTGGTPIGTAAVAGGGGTQGGCGGGCFGEVFGRVAAGRSAARRAAGGQAGGLFFAGGSKSTTGGGLEGIGSFGAVFSSTSGRVDIPWLFAVLALDSEALASFGVWLNAG